MQFSFLILHSKQANINKVQNTYQEGRQSRGSSGEGAPLHQLALGRILPEIPVHLDPTGHPLILQSHSGLRRNH